MTSLCFYSLFFLDIICDIMTSLVEFVVVLSVCLNVSAFGLEQLRTVQIGVILPFGKRRMFSVGHVAPVLDFVTTYVRRRSLLRQVRYQLHFRDSRCNSKDAPIQAFNLHRDHYSDVIFGPVCDYSLAPVARYAPYWNVPIVTPGGFAHDFGANKRRVDSEYSTLTRVGMTFNSLSVYLIKTLFRFNWRKVKVIYDVDAYNDITPGYCFLAASALIYYSKKVGLNYDFHIFIPKNQDVGHVLRTEVTSDYSSEYWLHCLIYISIIF